MERESMVLEASQRGLMKRGWSLLAAGLCWALTLLPAEAAPLPADFLVKRWWDPALRKENPSQRKHLFLKTQVFQGTGEAQAFLFQEWLRLDEKTQEVTRWLAKGSEGGFVKQGTRALNALPLPMQWFVWKSQGAAQAFLNAVGLEASLPVTLVRYGMQPARLLVAWQVSFPPTAPFRSIAFDQEGFYPVQFRLSSGSVFRVVDLQSLQALRWPKAWTVQGGQDSSEMWKSELLEYRFEKGSSLPFQERQPQNGSLSEEWWQALTRYDECWF